MNNNLKFFFFLVLGFFFAATSVAVKTQFAPNPDEPNNSVEIDLPFPYQSLSLDQKIQYLVAGSYGHLTPESELSFLLLGPLQPCFMVKFHNKVNNHILAFHIHRGNALDSMIEVVKQEFTLTEADKIDVAMFSVRNLIEEQRIALMIPGWTQELRMKEIRNQIANELHIPKGNIRGRLQKWPSKLNLGQFSFLLAGYLLVDKSGQLFITDPFIEDIFGFNQSMVDLVNPHLKQQVKTSFKALPLFERLKFFSRMDNQLQSQEIEKVMKKAKGEFPVFKSHKRCLLEFHASEEETKE